MSQQVRQSMLEYYQQHQITPVRYDLSSMDAHMERRFSLYTKLGMPPLAFRNANVLEVAAGTGHNSLFIAQCMPAHLVLLEPNEAGVVHIHEVYNGFSVPHTAPNVICKTLEDYTPSEQFDIVLCENWLGTNPHEQVLLQKLACMVAPQGMLVVTSVSTVGIAPNLIRRFLSNYLAPQSTSFEERTEKLVSAFSSHLSTISAMTRTHTDWVQDNMMHPAYFELCLTMPNLLESLSEHFDVVGSSPVFCEDWRWFKGMHGANRKFNEQFLSEYWTKAHNFLDYREVPVSGSAEKNVALERKSLHLLNEIAKHDDAHINKGVSKEHVQGVLTALDSFIEAVPSNLTATIAGLEEARVLVEKPELVNIESVASMNKFNALFGREASYMSFVRAR